MGQSDQESTLSRRKGEWLSRSVYRHTSVPTSAARPSTSEAQPILIPQRSRNRRDQTCQSFLDRFQLHWYLPTASVLQSEGEEEEEGDESVNL